MTPLAAGGSIEAQGSLGRAWKLGQASGCGCTGCEGLLLSGWIKLSMLKDFTGEDVLTGGKGGFKEVVMGQTVGGTLDGTQALVELDGEMCGT